MLARVTTLQPSAATAVRLSSLTLVLPAHNEAPNLPDVLAAAARILPTFAEAVDVVLVDDGSTDGSAALAQECARQHGLRLTVVRHPDKQGYGAAVGDGLRAATAEFVAFTDADGQFDLEDLGRFRPLVDSADLIGGWRLHRQDALMRSVVSGVFNTALRIALGLRVRDVDCALKLMRRTVLDTVHLEMRSALINAELYLRAQRAGFRIVQVEVSHHPRQAGRRSGARPRAIARAIRDIVRLRIRLAREQRRGS
jgi:glycosyltransferase involved in cell wall biosynthesis